MKGLFVLFVILFCNACSTIKTIAPAQQEIKISNNGKKVTVMKLPAFDAAKPENQPGFPKES